MKLDLRKNPNFSINASVNLLKKIQLYISIYSDLYTKYFEFIDNKVNYERNILVLLKDEKLKLKNENVNIYKQIHLAQEKIDFYQDFMKFNHFKIF